MIAGSNGQSDMEHIDPGTKYFTPSVQSYLDAAHVPMMTAS